jgi:hypothetical protein
MALFVFDLDSVHADTRLDRRSPCIAGHPTGNRESGWRVTSPLVSRPGGLWGNDGFRPANPSDDEIRVRPDRRRKCRAGHGLRAIARMISEIAAGAPQCYNQSLSRPTPRHGVAWSAQAVKTCPDRDRRFATRATPSRDDRLTG